MLSAVFPFLFINVIQPELGPYCVPTGHNVHYSHLCVISLWPIFFIQKMFNLLQMLTSMVDLLAYKDHRSIMTYNQ